MKINEWLGYNEQSSQYRLRRGELRALVNLQPRRLGMLISRRGMSKLFGSYSEEPIVGMYRKDTPFGQPDVYFIFHKVQVQKVIADTVTPSPYDSPYEYVWMVSRLSGSPFQSRVINQQPLSPNGLTAITNMSIAEDRFGRVFIFYGNGARPVMYRPTTVTNLAVEMGLTAPTDRPEVTPSGDGYFLERVDITAPGGAYWGPPSITVSGGNPDRTAIVKAIVQTGNLVGVEVVDGGANYKSPPTLTISSDKMGVGFRATGVIEGDGGVYGFVNTTLPTYRAQGLIGDTQVYGANNLLVGNKIMYISSPVSCSTTCVVGTAITNSTSMTVASVANVNVGDFVTVSPQKGDSRPTAFSNDKSPVRVVAVDASTNTVTLNKQWSSSANAIYNVQFRRNTTLETVDATYDPSTYAYTASLPLRTLVGAGNDAFATVKFAASSNGYALGTFSRSLYTTPTGGPSPSMFAYREVGWEVYALKGINYWNGHPTNPANTSANSVYAGLQASGSAKVYGYSGAVRASQAYRQTIDRRADVYWPDYSKISVWLCTGTFGEPITQWKRRDVSVKVSDGQPYIEVTLEPSMKSRTAASGRGGNTVTRSIPFERQANSVAPVVRINLAYCPDSWSITGNNGQNYPTNVKESKSDRLPWWNAAGTTPRPVVDVRGDQSGVRLDYGTVQIINPGSGWEKNTVFAVKLFQANAYAQTNDFNVGVKELTRKGAHQPFSTTSRYVTFVFQATAEDVAAVEGPPAEIVDPVSIDVGGSEYRDGDLAGITMARRDKDAAVESRVASFLGYISGTGQATEFVYTNPWTASSQSYSQSGTTITVTSTAHNLTEGDQVTFTKTTGTATTGTYRVTSVPSVDTFTLLSSTSVTTTGTCALSVAGRKSSGATITWLSGDAISAKLRTRDIIKCTTPNVLFDFSQLMSVNTSTSVLAIDKMAYPDASVTGTFTGTATAGSAVVTGVASTNKFIGVGQALRETSALMSANTCTILSVQDAGDGTRTLTLSVNASSSGTVTFSPAFAFQVYSGAKEAETLVWQAGTISVGTSSKRVTSINILNSGRNYLSAPSILVRGGGNGYGLITKANVEGGRVTSVSVLDPGIDYTSSPELYTSSAPAAVTPVMRPAMTGRYRCAYRFVDRSETFVSTVTATQVQDNATTAVVTSTTGIKAGMIAESALLPNMTKVIGIGPLNRITFSSPVTGLGQLLRVNITNPGSGYTATETITATLTDYSLPSWSCTIYRSPNENGSYSITQAVPTGTPPGGQYVPIREYSVAFSAPEGGGIAASGIATVTLISPSIDRTVTFRDLTKPVTYSDFSPIVDVDAGPVDGRDHASEMVWQLPGIKPPERADMVEFYRTSSEQSLVFYRLEMYGVPSDSGITIVGRDTLTDEELFDADRPNYAAVPVVLPNGNLNAFRFGQPRTDMAVCVAFQDRLWYAVSTSGEKQNTLFYSEFDEFESCPDTNELPIQNNQRSTDSLTALVPYGSVLLAMQHNHTYGITYNTDPGLDAAIQMLAHRGCLNQRCWDLQDNLLYAADENGIYVLSRSGEVAAISEPIKEFFTGELLDLSARATFFLTVCSRSRTLRFFCSFADQPSPTPTAALCYHLDQKTWWIERFPNSMSSAVTGRPQTSRLNCSIYGAADGNVYELNGDSDVSYRGVMSCNITAKSGGYKTAPKITCPAGYGVQLQGVVSEGRLVDILVQSSGYNVRHGWVLLTEDGDSLTTEGESLLTNQQDAPVPLTIDPAPVSDGRTAVAEAVFAPTTKLPYRASVVAGTNYVTLLGPPAFSVAGGDPPILTAEDDSTMVIEGVSGTFLTAENTPIEYGMEVFSECLPLGIVVKSILGSQVFFEYENGTAAVALNSMSDAQVMFVKKYKSHIPFRLATGAMQLINETNVQKGGDTLIDKSITVLYTPTESDKYLELIEYYNASGSPRPQRPARNRGGPGGFEHRQDSASTVLNVAEDSSELAAATGVAKATFAARSYADATGVDRHLRVELYGRPGSANDATDLVPQQVVIHSVTIDGVIEDAE